jgi:hypothetical protein
MNAEKLKCKHEFESENEWGDGSYSKKCIKLGRNRVEIRIY